MTGPPVTPLDLLQAGRRVGKSVTLDSLRRYWYGLGKYQPHQGHREMARRRGELGWQARQVSIE